MPQFLGKQCRIHALLLRCCDIWTDEFVLGQVKIFHAGTSILDGQLVSTGGRVLGVAAIGADAKQAKDLAYQVF